MKKWKPSIDTCFCLFTGYQKTKNRDQNQKHMFLYIFFSSRGSSLKTRQHDSTTRCTGFSPIFLHGMVPKFHKNDINSLKGYLEKKLNTQVACFFLWRAKIILVHPMID